MGFNIVKCSDNKYRLIDANNKLSSIGFNNQNLLLRFYSFIKLEINEVMEMKQRYIMLKRKGFL